jgi:hypothetical protein
MPPMYEPAVVLIGWVFVAFIVASIPVIVAWVLGGLFEQIKAAIGRL